MSTKNNIKMSTEPNKTLFNNNQSGTYPIVDSDFTKSEFQKNIVSFQLSTIEILKSPESKLNLIDSLIDYSNTLIKDCNSERERLLFQKNIIKVLHHLVFYIQYKIEYKKAIIQKLDKETVEAKLKILETTLNEIFEILKSLKMKDLQHSIPQEILKDRLVTALGNILNSITKYFFKKEHLRRETIELELMTKSFEEFVPALINKLYRRRVILGQSNLICGIMENYKDLVLHQPANEIGSKFDEKFKNAVLFRSNVREKTLPTISVVAFLYVFISVVLLIVVGIAQLFTEPLLLIGWLKNVWSWKYILLGASIFAYSIAWIYDLIVNHLLSKREKEMQLKIEAEFRVVLKRHYDSINQIYLYFNENSEALLSNEEINDMITDQINIKDYE